MATDSSGAQRIFPMLSYADAARAIDFLCAAFGFEEQFRMPMPDGSIGHAELSLHGHTVMLASAWVPAGMASPRDLTSVHGQLYCVVDDVDAHFERARARGAVVVAEPTDQPHGARTYRAVDPEGHRWVFGSPLAPAGVEAGDRGDEARSCGRRPPSTRPSPPSPIPRGAARSTSCASGPGGRESWPPPST
jgi:PhnB protein